MITQSIKSCFQPRRSYIILETKADNEIPPLTVGVRNAINHDKKREIVSLLAKLAKAISVLDSAQPSRHFVNRVAVHLAESERLRHDIMKIDRPFAS